MIGKTFSHYKILEKIGAGGMGEVYRAEDLRLHRQVAVKALPDMFAADPERMARFEREAKLLAALSHPNIAAIHGLEEAEGKRFLVLELVEGETLAQRLARGPLPFDEALDVCRQIAEGLEAAHEKSIVHRDLKPSNVKLTAEGKIKILDFGLARAFLDKSPVELITDSPTITAEMTQPGVILGTAAYMSPEQARGRAVDKRADIWAFGCILFECLTGKAAFPGETITDVLASVLKGEPDWEALPKDLSANVRVVLGRCLQKDRNLRYHDIADARIEIAEASVEPLKMPSARTRTKGSRLMTSIWVIAVLAVGITASLVTSRLKTHPAPTIHRATILLPSGTQITGGAVLGSIRTELALSPDGKSIIFSASKDGSAENAQLYLRAIEKSESVPIVGTSGAQMPFFSPDGQWVGFYAQGKLQKVPIAGGIPAALCELAAIPMGASWGPKGTIIIGGRNGGLRAVSDTGGKLIDLTTLDPTTEASHRLPSFLPGGETVLLTVMPHQWGTQGRTEALSLKSGKRKVLEEDGTDARYVPTGHFVYLQRGTLFAEPFDPERLEPLGPAIPVLQGVMHALNSINGSYNSGAGQYGFSNSGTLLYSSGGMFPDGDRELFWVNRKGEAEPIKSVGKKPFLYPRISPDGLKIAYESTGKNWSIWVYDLVRGTSTKLTSDGVPGGPVWTPDNSRVAFETSDAGVRNIYWMPWDGSRPKERVTTSKFEQYPAFFTPNNQFMCYIETTKVNHIWLLRLDNREVSPIAQTESGESWPECSPDSQWLAYGSDTSGQYEIYVTSLQSPGGRRIPISVGGGREPIWARNGRELFYWSLDGKKLMVVDTVTKPSFQVGTPRLQFSFQYLRFSGKRGYDIHPDGQRFLITGPVTVRSEPITQLNLVVNWFEELKRLVPVKK